MNALNKPMEPNKQGDEELNEKMHNNAKDQGLQDDSKQCHQLDQDEEEIDELDQIFDASAAKKPKKEKKARTAQPKFEKI